MWDKPAYKSKGIGTAEMHLWYNTYAGEHDLESRGRATIINSMNELEALGFLESYTITGKGGERKLYYPAVSAQVFSMKMVELFTDKIRGVFADPMNWWKPE